ncbi:MAG: NAD(P)/FAD-dependent oxidoreductase [Bacteroidetes bacterium]|nr:NAD(P)/FAD-dependent oxidoreductase [Bacteroidota bacterium]
MKDNFDIVIIGSGMGGLVCGDILGREGYRVCVLEKNKQIGGCLQTFVRDKVIFDSGVHYIGSLSKGQTLYQIFKYLDLIDSLKLEKMDENGFDKIIIEGDGKEYVFAQGYERFIRKLSADFPDEENAIRKYCERIREVCSKFPMYNLRTGGAYEEKEDELGIDAKTYIESLTANKKLRAVLAGNNILYAGQANKTPFYVHALILNSYIESAWKCVDGGSQIAKQLAKNIRKYGGIVKNHAEVKKIVDENGTISHVELADGSKVHAKYFISDMHPAKTLEITTSSLIKNAYRNRIKNLENSISSFSLNIVFKKNSFRYSKQNYYYHRKNHVWTMGDYTEENWPLGYAIFFPATSGQKEYAEGMTIFTYMKYEDVAEWEKTFNTVSAKEERGDSYEAFKKKKAERLLDVVEEKFPGLRTHIKTYYTSTPLSYRDYIGSDDGSMYGIVKDYKDPLKTLIAARTKLPNLYLTGQNLNLHGILGSAISSLVTCAVFLGNEDFVEKIKNA